MDDRLARRLAELVDLRGVDLEREGDVERVAGRLLDAFWRDHDPTAFELLVVLTHEPLFAIARRITRRLGVAVDPDDLLATLFQRLFVTLDGPEAGVRSFFGFAHTAMRNEALNTLRKLSRASARHVVYATHQDVLPPPDPAVVAEARESIDEVKRTAATFLGVVAACFHDLRERDRRVLMAREVDALSYDEIADVLDLPRGQVGMILKRARERLEVRVLRALRRGSAGDDDDERVAQ